MDIVHWLSVSPTPKEKLGELLLEFLHYVERNTIYQETVEYCKNNISLVDYKYDATHDMVGVECTWKIGDLTVKFFYYGGPKGNQPFYIKCIQNERMCYQQTTYVHDINSVLEIKDEILDILRLPKDESYLVFKMMNLVSFHMMF